MKVLASSKGVSKPLMSLEKKIALISLSHTQSFHVHWHVQSGNWSGFHGNYGNWTSNSFLWSLISCHLQMPLSKEAKQWRLSFTSLSLSCFSALPSPFKSLKEICTCVRGLSVWGKSKENPWWLQEGLGHGCGTAHQIRGWLRSAVSISSMEEAVSNAFSSQW